MRQNLPLPRLSYSSSKGLFISERMLYLHPLSNSFVFLTAPIFFFQYSSSCQRFKHNASFMSRLSTRTRKDTSSGHTSTGSVLSPLNSRRVLSRRDQVGHGSNQATSSSLSPLDCTGSYSKLDRVDSSSLDLDRLVRPFNWGNGILPL